jgi:hypothetical protein
MTLMNGTQRNAMNAHTSIAQLQITRIMMKAGADITAGSRVSEFQAA